MEPEIEPETEKPKPKRRRRKPAAQQAGIMSTVQNWRGTVGTVIGTVLGVIGVLVTFLADIGVDTSGVCEGHETVRFIERQQP